MQNPSRTPADSRQCHSCPASRYSERSLQPFHTDAPIGATAWASSRPWPAAPAWRPARPPKYGSPQIYSSWPRGARRATSAASTRPVRQSFRRGMSNQLRRPHRRLAPSSFGLMPRPRTDEGDH
eukprot:scaffold11465_cov105-Isochrysis_galbana.AAC.6